VGMLVGRILVGGTLGKDLCIESIWAITIAFGRLLHIASSYQKNGHFFSNASLMDCSLSVSVTPHPDFSYIAFISFHCFFIFAAFSPIFFTVI